MTGGLLDQNSILNMFLFVFSLSDVKSSENNIKHFKLDPLVVEPSNNLAKDIIFKEPSDLPAGAGGNIHEAVVLMDIIYHCLKEVVLVK